MPKMKAAVFAEVGRIVLDEKPIPDVGPTDALVRITTTTICGTDVHILKGEYPVRKGLTIGHEPIGILEKVGSQVKGYVEGQRVLCAATTPCGQCSSCMMGQHSQCGGTAAGGWMLGNYLDGCQAEYFVMPNAQANMAVIPDGVSDEEVLLVPDIVSTGFAAAEQGGIKIGDTVVIFAQGPIGLCATAGARQLGAGLVIAVDPVPARREKALLMGADLVFDPRQTDIVAEVMRLTKGAGADVALECLGLTETLANGLACVRPGGTVSSVGVYSQDILVPLAGFGAGLAGKRIVTSTCPGGKDRMARLLKVIENGRVRFDSLVTHHFKLDDIEAAYRLFASQADGVIKIAVTP